MFRPTEESSIGGENFFITFLDDCTRRVWIYILHKKSDVFSKFKIFKALVENQSGHKIKCLQTDNGREFFSLEFDSFCVDNGICSKIVPFTPQENGAAKRMNRTILEKSHCMLSNVGLGKEFLAEACNTAIYLINQSPSSRLDFGIPKEECLRNKISYSHIQVFGCEAYVHVPKEKRQKLDPKSQKGIFVGYGEDQFGFQIWDLVRKKIIKSRDVIFNEKVFPALHKEENMV